MISTTSATERTADALDENASSDLIAIANHQAFAGRNPLTSASRLTLPGSDANIELHGNPNRVRSQFNSTENRAIYLWGRAAHPIIPAEQLLAWCGEVVASGNLTRLRDLHGMFVIIIDDRGTSGSGGEVTFISDILGIRPWFVGSFRGKLVAGSNVLSICAAGLSEGKVNYDEVGAWLRYNHPTDSASVVTDYQCMRPGEVITLRADGSVVRRQTYGDLDFGFTEASREAVIEESFDAISKSIQIMTRDLTEVNLPLSGGYDSRLVFAIASGLPSPRLHLSNLKTREYETKIAQQVAAAMHHPLQLISARKRIFDLFDEPFCFTPGGFITGRNLTNHIAAMHPGMPLLSGFMGDGVMRGSLLDARNAHFAMDAGKSPNDDLVAAIDKRYIMHGHRLRLLNDETLSRIGARARESIRKVVQRGQAVGRPTIYSDLYCRHRLYYANIALQHLDTAEAIIPFCNFNSLNVRVKYHHSAFDSESYPRLFARFFPQLGEIEHSYLSAKNLKRNVKHKTPPTRHLRRWSADLAAGLLLTNVLEGAKKKKIFSLLPSGLLGETRYQEEIAFLYKVMMFERKLRKHRISFDWGHL